MPGVAIEGLREDLEFPRPYVVERLSYSRLLDMASAAVDGWLGELLSSTWATRSFSAAYERPLLLLAALRYAGLKETADHPLHRAFVSSPAEASVITEALLREAFASPRVQQVLRERAVQTNETTRAVAWLWPARLLARAGVNEPITLVDLGASAGLNLIADALPTPWVDQHGVAIEVAPRPDVAVRLGIDRSPIDARDQDDADWLRACVWQDDLERLSRLEHALARMQATAGTSDAPRVVRCPLDEVAEPLATLPAHGPVIVLQSVVRDYLPPPALARFQQAIAAFMHSRPPFSVLWSQLELAHRDEPPERAMTLSITTYDDDGELRERELARTHAHPRVLYRNATAEAELVDRLTRSLSPRS